jgi:hypothetical protein
MQTDVILSPNRRDAMRSNNVRATFFSVCKTVSSYLGESNANYADDQHDVK